MWCGDSDGVWEWVKVWGPRARDENCPAKEENITVKSKSLNWRFEKKCRRNGCQNSTRAVWLLETKEKNVV